MGYYDYYTCKDKTIWNIETGLVDLVCDYGEIILETQEEIICKIEVGPISISLEMKKDNYDNSWYQKSKIWFHNEVVYCSISESLYPVSVRVYKTGAWERALHSEQLLLI